MDQQGSALCHYGKGQPRAIFMAANGFPVRSYDFLLEPLAESLPLIGLENRGARLGAALPPRDFSWRHHAADLLQALETHGASEPVIGIGHSIGATVTTLAAARSPTRFRALVLIDPATIPGRWLPWVARLLPWTTAKMPLVQRTRRRRVQWESHEDFARYHAEKAAYRHFTPRAMQDYARAGLRPAGRGYELAYSREWEAWNFQRTAFLWPALRKLKMPVLLLRGEHSYLHPSDEFERHCRRLGANVEVITVEGTGHMLPQEAPERVLSLIRGFCERHVA